MNLQLYNEEINRMAEYEGLTGAIRVQFMDKDLILVEEEDNQNSILLRKDGETFVTVGCFLGRHIYSSPEKRLCCSQSQEYPRDFLALASGRDASTGIWSNARQNSIRISDSKYFSTLAYITFLIGTILSLHLRCNLI